VSLNRSPGGLELVKALLGFHSSFDRSMILLQDVVQVLDRSMSAAAAQGSFLFHYRNRRAVEAGLISVDDAGLRMRWIAERLAEQTLGRRGIAQCRQQEVDGGTGGIDGPIEVTPTAPHSNIRVCGELLILPESAIRHTHLGRTSRVKERTNRRIGMAP